MTVGGGIFLIAVGAIIRYAINFEIGGVEEATIGLILIIAGIAVVILGLLTAPFRLWAERRRAYGPPTERGYDRDYRY
jgi:hypothetical protein